MPLFCRSQKPRARHDVRLAGAPWRRPSLIPSVSPTSNRIAGRGWGRQRVRHYWGLADEYQNPLLDSSASRVTQLWSPHDEGLVQKVERFASASVSALHSESISSKVVRLNSLLTPQQHLDQRRDVELDQRSRSGETGNKVDQHRRFRACQGPRPVFV
ncbi:hypothetical protein LZ30DRAFT_685473 [Colletotrichum cereale]|nr:hypothetical protein LZ30DRAFT_685473 [Colletotrichum cereale]